jgi:hypothetical protein
MVQYQNNFKKEIAIAMRKDGNSYNLINRHLHVPISTLSFWLKDIKLSLSELNKLKKYNLLRYREAVETKKSNTLQKRDNLFKRSLIDIPNISKKDLWIMGIILYWRERLINDNRTDLYRGVHFTSSDEYLIKLFIKWLTIVGNILSDEIYFDIFVKKTMKNNLSNIISHWSAVTGFDNASFPRIYFLNSPAKRSIKSYQQSRFGYLRIRVKSSSLLARQIAGWIEAIKTQL